MNRYTAQHYYLLKSDMENQNQVYIETADITLRNRLDRATHTMRWMKHGHQSIMPHRVWINQLILSFWTVLLTQTHPQPTYLCKYSPNSCRIIINVK